MVFKVRGDHENAGYIKSLDRLTASNHKIEREVDEKKCGPIQTTESVSFPTLLAGI